MFSTTILSWFHAHGRELPWRNTTDPYPIWLSEIILQQTRIAQGWEYWERFMHHYPTVAHLAEASEDEVLKLWQGLGYYSRARNLHKAAKQVVALGKFPDTLESIKCLPGIGDYTAAAIGSFAFGIKAAVVDGNVYRVLSRYFGISTPINTTQGKKEFAALAQSLLPNTDVAAYNQGIMDFGALQCTPQSPQCAECPLALTCEAYRNGEVSLLPIKQKKLQVKTRHLCYIYIRYRQTPTSTPLIAMRRRGEGDIWQGLWEPFNASIHEDAPMKASEILSLLHLPTSSASSSDALPRLSLLVSGKKHVLTHRILLADFYLLEVDALPSISTDYQWIEEDKLQDYGIPRLIEILFEKVER